MQQAHLKNALVPFRELAPLFVALALLALTGSMLPEYLTGPDTLVPPGRDYWLGTNDIGQSVLIGIVRAAPVTMSIALVTAGLALTVAFMAASLAAIFPSFPGVLILRLTDMLEIIPSVLFLLLVAAWYQPGYAGLVLLLAATTWYDDVRAVRAVLLRELARENVSIARLTGGSWFYCLTRHVLPAIQPALAALFLQNVAQATMRAAGLAFLGLSDPRLLSWGGLIDDAMDYLHSPAWSWLLLPPALCLSLFLLGVIALAKRIEARVVTQGEGVE